MQSVGVAALPGASARPLLVGLLAVGAGLVPAVATSLLSPWSAAGAAVGYLLGAALIGGSWRGPRFGLANAVTLARLVGTCWVGGLTIEAAVAGLDTGDRLLLIALATGCLILDGVDGRVARARGEVSGFGARFDMETDALLLLCLSLVIPIARRRRVVDASRSADCGTAISPRPGSSRRCGCRSTTATPARWPPRSAGSRWSPPWPWTWSGRDGPRASRCSSGSPACAGLSVATSRGRFGGTDGHRHRPAGVR